MAVRAQEHCFTSDLKRATVTLTTVLPKSRILKTEGKDDFWRAPSRKGNGSISKVILTLFAGHGRDALMTDVLGLSSR
jgi:hypothetical protein